MSDDECLFTFGNSSRKVPVIINGQEVPMIIDSEALWMSLIIVHLLYCQKDLQ